MKSKRSLRWSGRPWSRQSRPIQPSGCASRYWRSMVSSAVFFGSNGAFGREGDQIIVRVVCHGLVSFLCRKRLARRGTRSGEGRNRVSRRNSVSSAHPPYLVPLPDHIVTSAVRGGQSLVVMVAGHQVPAANILQQRLLDAAALAGQHTTGVKRDSRAAGAAGRAARLRRQSASCGARDPAGGQPAAAPACKDGAGAQTAPCAAPPPRSCPGT